MIIMIITVEMIIMIRIMIILITFDDQEGRLPLHYAATREELKPIYTALVSKGEYDDDGNDDDDDDEDDVDYDDVDDDDDKNNYALFIFVSRTRTHCSGQQ